MTEMHNSTNLTEVVTHPPGWDRKQVRDRVREACEWAELYLHESKPTEVHRDTLQAKFGARGKDIGQYLRGALLIRHTKHNDGHNGGVVKSTSYLLNKDNLLLLQSLLSSTHSSVAEVVTHRATAQILPPDTKVVTHCGFEYIDKSHRLWHEAQRIRRDKKDAYWVERGMPFNYDIVSAAPTILVQLAELAGLRAKNLTAVMTYLAAPKKFRAYVARIAGLDADDAKQLLTSMFNGARLACTPYCSAFNLLGRDKTRMKALQDDLNVSLLVSNIAAVWSALRLSTHLPLKTGSEKWSLYFEYERAILEIAVQYFNELGISYFLEHDGYRTSEKIDTAELEARVLRELQLRIRLENK